MNVYNVVPVFIFFIVILIICEIGLLICKMADKIKRNKYNNERTY